MAPPSDTVGLADVIVVGGGGSGLAAAIEAATVGRSVILLEKHSALGGTTAWSVGSLSATSTPHQIKRGIKDGPDGHFEDLPKFAEKLGAPDNPELRRILVDNVPFTLRWLMEMGVEFFGPMPEPPHKLPRMHNILPNSRAYIYHCARRARRLGVDIRTSQRVHNLCVEDGKVVGVFVGEEGAERLFRARGGVVLASGDYSASPEMKRNLIGEDFAALKPINVNNTGDGQRMAGELGGRVLNGHLAHMGLRFVSPRRNWMHALPPYRLFTRAMRLTLEHVPSRILRPFIMRFMTTVLEPARTLFTSGGLLLNKRGERVVIKKGAQADIVAAVKKQPEHQVFILLDSVGAKYFDEWPNFISTAPGIAYAYFSDYRRSRPDICRRAASLEDLASLSGMELEALRAAVAAHNAAADANPGSGLHLGHGGWWLLGPAGLHVTFTDGGLAVDTSLRVLDVEGDPIPGLFAAGSAGQGGLLLEGHGHHLAWAFTSGRIAGRNAAYAVITEPSTVATQ